MEYVISHELSKIKMLKKSLKKNIILYRKFFLLQNSFLIILHVKV